MSQPSRWNLWQRVGQVRACTSIPFSISTACGLHHCETRGKKSGGWERGEEEGAGGGEEMDEGWGDRSTQAHTQHRRTSHSYCDFSLECWRDCPGYRETPSTSRHTPGWRKALWGRLPASGSQGCNSLCSAAVSSAACTRTGCAPYSSESLTHTGPSKH